MKKISDSEWIVMKVIWGKSPITASEIIEKLKESTAWNSKTIHTLISRLVAKDAIGVIKESAFYQYYPLISQEECAREETKSLLERVYDGSLKLLMVDFLKDQKLSQKDIEELQRLLDEKKDGRS